MKKDPVFGPHQEVVGAIKQSFPQASGKAITEAVRVLRASNRANGGA